MQAPQHDRNKDRIRISLFYLPKHCSTSVENGIFVYYCAVRGFGAWDGQNTTDIL